MSDVTGLQPIEALGASRTASTGLQVMPMFAAHVHQRTCTMYGASFLAPAVQVRT